MNRDLELKVQAYLDGELSDRETERVRDWLEEEGAARVLLTELSTTKAFMEDGEVTRSLPESRDFYWSKIRREIERSERLAPADRVPTWLAVLRRWLAPAAGVALLVLLGFVALSSSTSDVEDSVFAAVVETPSDEIGSYSFRSESENIFVVWVYDRSPGANERGGDAGNDL